MDRRLWEEQQLLMSMIEIANTAGIFSALHSSIATVIVPSLAINLLTAIHQRTRITARHQTHYSRGLHQLRRLHSNGIALDSFLHGWIKRGLALLDLLGLGRNLVKDLESQTLHLQLVQYSR